MTFTKMMTYFEIMGMTHNRSLVSDLHNDNTDKVTYLYHVIIKKNHSSVFASVLYKITGSRCALVHADIVWEGTNYRTQKNTPSKIFKGGAKCYQLENEFCS